MSRKNWSNLFISLAALNVAASALPANPIKLANWVAIPCCVALGTLARRRMIYKNTLAAVTAFGKEECGQDLVEYSLLMGFIALAVTALLTGVGTTVKGVWTTVNSGMTAAKTAAS
jgi:Flp pilus assembly pilin Flp